MLLLTVFTTMTAWAQDVTLPSSYNYTANDGEVLTGSTDGTVTIAAGAKITLSDATINGGIVCAGTAEITLIGTNDVTGAWRKAGIQVGGSGTTLTIKGDGELTATGGYDSAGIGLSRAWDEDAIGGDIVIEGGIITATGEDMGAGIGLGAAFDDSPRTIILGDITIKGGNITAIGGNQGNGIGTGFVYGINDTSNIGVGTITITTGIDRVDASSISKAVVYKDGETDVTANVNEYLNITEDGDHRIIVPKDDTDYTITIADGIEHGTIACAATTAKYGEKLTIKATPDYGYHFVRLVVKDAQNNDVESTGKSFFMPQSNVTVSAIFEQGFHGTTEFKWFYRTGPAPEDEVLETIYDGVTTVNIQNSEMSYQIRKCEDEYNYQDFLLDNDTYVANIPYAGGTGVFPENDNGTNFRVPYDGETGFYDITMTDVGNGKWSVSILKTVPVIADVTNYGYTGSEITPEPLVMAGSLTLVKNQDYEYSYSNNTEIGTAKVRVVFLNTYASLGTVEKEFKIVNVKQLSDGTAYTSTSDVSETTAIYTKSIGDERVGKYQAWFVPFDYTVTTDDLEKFDFFKINFIANAAEEGVNPEDDHVYIFLNPIAAGTTLYGNKPYVYRAKEAVDNYSFTTENTTLLAKNESSVLQTSTALANYDFYGTYDDVTATPSSPFYYISINGNVCYGTSVTVGPYRWILRATSKGGVSYAPQITFSEGETTAIDHSTFNVQRSTFNVYDLQGRKVANGQLKKGLYIVNGRKVVIK